MGLGLLGGNPTRDTTSVCADSNLHRPPAHTTPNTWFQEVQQDMWKPRSVWKEWDFVSKVTELSVGRFLIEYFTPLTLGEQQRGVASDEDATEVWMSATEEAINKV